MKILFVCTGNLCRSPMAEALLKDLLVRRGCRDVDVSSAGTWAAHDHGASEGAASVLRDRGLDLADHRSRPLDPTELAATDIVIVMTSVHVSEVLSLDSTVGRKLFLIKEFPELELPAHGVDRVNALFEARRPEPRRSLDLDDPIGLPLMAYERCAREIDTAVHALAQWICGETDVRQDGG